MILVISISSKRIIRIHCQYVPMICRQKNITLIMGNAEIPGQCFKLSFNQVKYILFFLSNEINPNFGVLEQNPCSPTFS
jgi:hypothetical protein